MLDYQLHENSIQNLETFIAAEIKDLAANRTGDFGDYRYSVGRIAGLRDAVAVLHETLKIMQEG